MLSEAYLSTLLRNVAMIGYLLVGLAIIHGMVLIALKKREPKETLANICVYVGYIVVKKYLTASITLGAFFLAYQFRLFELPLNWITFLCSIVITDFLYYAKHRLEHRVLLLWVAHSVHHSSVEFNLSTALRLPWLTPFYAWMAYVPAVLLGFHPLMVACSIAIVLVFQFLIHTETVGKWPLLEGILNTPSNHRVHHGSNRQYLDKNYGGILIIWDRLFGTYKAEGEKVVYGLTKPINTTHPVEINLIEAKNLLTEIRSAKTWLDGAKISLSPPGYKLRQRDRKKKSITVLAEDIIR